MVKKCSAKEPNLVSVWKLMGDLYTFYYHVPSTDFKAKIDMLQEGNKAYLFFFFVMLCYVMLCYVMLCYVMLCYVMLCYVMLCYVMLCYVMLCYVMLCYD